MGSRGINKVIIVGNVGVEPEVRTFENGKLVANLTVVTSESWRDKNTGETKEVSDWHKVVVYGSAAKIVKDYVRKGTQIYLEGKLKTRKWEDQSGKTNYTTEIQVDSVDGRLQMLGAPPQNKSGSSAPQNSAAPTNNNPPLGDYSNLPPNDMDDYPPF